MSETPLNLQSQNSGSYVIDVTLENFQEQVLAASLQRPVIVDFWAEWCGPCKTLIPMLEKSVNALNGKVILAKIDIDKNQMIAQQMRIQSVPTVLAFIGGQPVDAFQGAVPQSELDAFLDRTLQAAAQAGIGGGDGPDIEEILASADTLFNAGDLGGAAEAYSTVAGLAGEEAPDPRALAGLARCHVAAENFEQAQEMIDLIPVEKRNDPAISSVIAALELAKNDPGKEALAGLEAAVTANPKDLQAVFDYAEGLIGAGEMAQAATNLLDIIAQDRSWNDEAARKKLLTIFDALGPMDEVTQNARRRLSSILFS